MAHYYSRRARHHLQYLREEIQGKELKLAIYIYEQTYLVGKKTTPPLAISTLVSALGVSKRTIENYIKALNDCRILRLSQVQVRAHSVRYKLYLPRLPLRQLSKPVKSVSNEQHQNKYVSFVGLAGQRRRIKI